MKRLTIICILFILSLTMGVCAEEKAELFDTAVSPETYLLRPGDKLLVTFINSQIEPINLEIDPEGKIVNATIGLFDLHNKTLAFAKKELTEILKQLYNVNEIDVSITAPRGVSISVYGSVKNPGIYKGMTSERVSDIIKKAGGISDNGSSRNILFYGGENYLNVDLDKAVYLGDFKSNPHLYAGNAIEIPAKSSKTVQITGDVNFPREVELKEGDDISMLIQLAGKFNNAAIMSDVQIIRGHKKVDNKDIQAGDIIVVKSSFNNENKTIKLFGAVNNQGIYPYVESVTLDDILTQAGGYSKTANVEMTTVFRQPLVDSHGKKSQIRYPISIPFQTTTQIVLQLAVNDSIFVPWQVGFVKVSGAVINPGYFPYQKDKDILYYVKSAGGFLPISNKDEIQIFNPISENTILVSSGVVVPDGAEIIIQVKEELK